MNAGTLNMVTHILRISIYSGCSRKKFVAILLAAALAAGSSVGIRTSHVSKLLRQKYWQGTPAVRSRSSKFSFLSPTNLLVLRSVTTRETIRGSIFFTISGMGKISFPLKNSAYLPTFLIVFQISLGPFMYLLFGLDSVS